MRSIRRTDAFACVFGEKVPVGEAGHVQRHAGARPSPIYRPPTHLPSLWPAVWGWRSSSVEARAVVVASMLLAPPARAPLLHHGLLTTLLPRRRRRRTALAAINNVTDHDLFCRFGRDQVIKLLKLTTFTFIQKLPFPFLLLLKIL
jgi:hypothetical protein